MSSFRSLNFTRVTRSTRQEILHERCHLAQRAIMLNTSKYTVKSKRKIRKEAPLTSSLSLSADRSDLYDLTSLRVRTSTWYRDADADAAAHEGVTGGSSFWKNSYDWTNGNATTQSDTVRVEIALAWLPAWLRCPCAVQKSCSSTYVPGGYSAILMMHIGSLDIAAVFFVVAYSQTVHSLRTASATESSTILAMYITTSHRSVLT